MEQDMEFSLARQIKEKIKIETGEDWIWKDGTWQVKGQKDLCIRMSDTIEQACTLSLGQKMSALLLFVLRFVI